MYMRTRFGKKYRMARLLLSCMILFLQMPLAVHATEDDRRRIPVETNEIAEWPEGPLTTAKAAVLMEAETGVVLYGKNMHAQL